MKKRLFLSYKVRIFNGESKASYGHLPEEWDQNSSQIRSLSFRKRTDTMGESSSLGSGKCGIREEDIETEKCLKIEIVAGMDLLKKKPKRTRKVSYKKKDYRKRENEGGLM